MSGAASTGDAAIAADGSWTAALDRFDALIASLPRSHPRVIGAWMLRVAAVALLPATLVGTAPTTIASAALFAGALLARPPIARLPGVGWGAAFSAWIVLSTLI